MATVNVQASLNIVGTAVNYRSLPPSFVGNTVSEAGPAPGSFLVPHGGAAVDFSKLATPGYCRIMNQDSTNFITVGMRDAITNRFYPMLEILPLETYPLRWSRDMLGEFSGTGTHPVTGPENVQVWILPNAAPCRVLVEAFEA